VKDFIGAAQPAEKVFDRHQAAALRAEAERLAVRLAVAVHVPLIAFKDRTRHVLRLEQFALLAPLQKSD